MAGLKIHIGYDHKIIDGIDYYVLMHVISGNSRDYFSEEDRKECQKHNGKLTKNTKDGWIKQISRHLTEKNKNIQLAYLDFNGRLELQMPKGFMDEFVEELKVKFSDFHWEIHCNGYSGYSTETYLQIAYENMKRFGSPDMVVFNNDDITDGKLDVGRYSVIVLWKLRTMTELVGENIKRIIVV